ncbi:MAG: hypothetical protein KKI08_10430 [Armatimonadetes bacterium]|nr:hypothetical protein [Armatimonadota bacterium]
MNAISLPRYWLVLLGLCAAATPAIAADTGVQVADKGQTVKEITEGPAAGSEVVGHAFVLTNATCRYGINYNGYWSKDGGAKATPEGYLGMPLPGSDNWYGGGFLDVVANGKSLGNTRPLPPRTVEQGDRGLIEILFPTQPTPVRLRFLLEPDTDYLVCEIAANAPLKSLSLNLRCFPSYFTSWNKKDGWRQVISASGMLEQGGDATLQAATDNWFFYQDRVFDFATNADSSGPCAVLMLPEQAQSARVVVSSYPVSTGVTCKPDLTSVRLAFWDFRKQPNAAALEHLKAIAPQVAERLRKLDLNDRGVAAFNARGERAKLDELIAHSSDPAKWKQTLVPMFEAITAALDAYKGGDFIAEQKAAEAIAKYREGLWDLKFDALLTD